MVMGKNMTNEGIIKIFKHTWVPVFVKLLLFANNEFFVICTVRGDELGLI